MHLLLEEAVSSNQDWNPGVMKDCLFEKPVLVRSEWSGVWYGVLISKVGKQIILQNARRLWRWHANKGFTLVGVAKHGLYWKDSKLTETVDAVWVEAGEILPCSSTAIDSISRCPSASNGGNHHGT